MTSEVNEIHNSICFIINGYFKTLETEASFAHQSSRGGPRGQSGAHFGRETSRGFSDQRAFDIFNAFFAEMDEFHQSAFGGRDPFGGFGMMGAGGMGGQRNRSSNRGFGGGPFGSFHDEFFGGGDPFGTDMFGSGARGGGGMSSSFTSFSSSSSSSSSFGGGRGGMSTSTQTKTYIGPDGRRVTRKETTGTTHNSLYSALLAWSCIIQTFLFCHLVIHPDGRRESNVEEFVDDSQARLGYTGGGTSFSFSSGEGGGSGAVAPMRHQSSSRSSAGSSSQRNGRF